MAVLAFAATIADGATSRVKRRIPMNGDLRSISINFPSNTSNLLGFRLHLRRRNKSHQLIPHGSDSMIWDDGAVNMTVQIPVREGEEFEVQWDNASGGELRSAAILTLE